MSDFGVDAGINLRIGTDEDGRSSVDKIFDDSYREWATGRILKPAFSATAALGSIAAVYIQEGPAQNRQWEIRRFVANIAYPVGVTPPGVVTTSANQSGTGAASAITLTVPAVPGQINQVSSFTVSGTGATAGSTIQITLAGVQGGTQTFDYVVPAGAAVAAPTLEVNFNPPLVASAANTAIVLTVPSFGAGNLASAAEIEAQTVTGSVQVFLFSDPGGLGMISPTTLSEMTLLWSWTSAPVLPINQLWGRDEVTAIFPDNVVLVFVNNGPSFTLSGQMQVLDRPIYLPHLAPSRLV